MAGDEDRDNDRDDNQDEDRVVADSEIFHRGVGSQGPASSFTTSTTLPFRPIVIFIFQV